MNQRSFRLTCREPPPGSEAANAGIPTTAHGNSTGFNGPSQIGHESGCKPREEVIHSEFYRNALLTERPFAFTKDTTTSLVVGNHWKNRLQVVKHWPRIPSSAVALVENTDSTGTTIIDRSHNGYARSPEMVSEYFFGKTMLGESVNSAYAHVIEYDLDDQDLNWLYYANVDRKSLQMLPISTHDMGLLLDCFEKGWFALSRASRRLCAINIGGGDNAIACDICHESDTVLDNIIVICDCCNIAVHQDCYGASLVPEGPWFCQRCAGDEAPSCAVCPWTLGPLQRTSDKRLPWIHATCASFLNGEVSDMCDSQIRKISGIHSGRWKLPCVICKNSSGKSSAPIQCSMKNCYCAFHLYCAEAVGCQIDWGTKLASCPKHSGCEVEAARVSSEYSSFDVFERESSLKKLQARSLFSNPVVPATLIDAILKDTDALVDYADDEHERRELLYVIARYWALKKARIHGASLVKCFDIDPWSHSLDSSVAHKKRLLLGRLRHVKEMCELLLQRETSKRKSILQAQELFYSAIDPMQTILLLGCKMLRELDTERFFEEPVLASEVPDYYDVIKNPCCMQLIVRRVKERCYTSISHFMQEVKLIYSNAILYNEEGSIYREAAERFWKGAVLIESDLSSAICRIHSPGWAHIVQTAKDAILLCTSPELESTLFKGFIGVPLGVGQSEFIIGKQHLPSLASHSNDIMKRKMGEDIVDDTRYKLSTLAHGEIDGPHSKRLKGRLSTRL